MRVLLSIKPEYAEKIFNGTKDYEYRKAIFQKQKVNKIVVYASSPVGKVIGEFEIDKVIIDSPSELWEKTRDVSGVSKEFFFQYFAEKSVAYAIKVKKPKLYNQPLSLEDFSIFTPPQSYVYLPQ